MQVTFGLFEMGFNTNYDKESGDELVCLWYLCWNYWKYFGQYISMTSIIGFHSMINIKEVSVLLDQYNLKKNILPADVDFDWFFSDKKK